MKTRHRAYAYMTHRGRILLFTQPLAPDSGVQVPAGTIKPGEDPAAAAALREAIEETGLTEIEMVRFLGQDTRDMSDCGSEELQYRWFYHASCLGEPPETWSHGEYDEQGNLLHPFDFFWADLRAMPKLVANYDDFIPRLLETMNGAPR